MNNDMNEAECRSFLREGEFSIEDMKTALQEGIAKQNKKLAGKSQEIIDDYRDKGELKEGKILMLYSYLASLEDDTMKNAIHTVLAEIEGKKNARKELLESLKDEMTAKLLPLREMWNSTNAHEYLDYVRDVFGKEVPAKLINGLGYIVLGLLKEYNISYLESYTLPLNNDELAGVKAVLEERKEGKRVDEDTYIEAVYNGLPLNGRTIEALKKQINIVIEEDKARTKANAEKWKMEQKRIQYKKDNPDTTPDQLQDMILKGRL
jgi:hypothetical protein